ncbi:hypothetical protein G4B88_030949 [Cannabis sativa]|uniref:Uncharacterized protein n=1 Tax=Cannabis sativa TaxID=3483 RepID=A0A7J6GME4_CANSA|nr:hypothetical protein G4B88_030949 [Cannabis sativa]
MNYEAKLFMVEDKDNELCYYGSGTHRTLVFASSWRKRKLSLGNDSNLRMKSCIAISGVSNPLEGKEQPRIVAPILGYIELNKIQLTNDLIELEIKDHDAALDMDWLSIHLLLTIRKRSTSHAMLYLTYKALVVEHPMIYQRLLINSNRLSSQI